MVKMNLYKGVLIDQSVADPRAILKNTTIVSTRKTTLEGENFRGTVQFHNIEVSEDNLWSVLDQVLKSIKSPGWYFHLVDKENLYFVMPHTILYAENNDLDLQYIIDYALEHGIHPEQLNLRQLFDNPFA